jgi:hypothetical protein
MAIGAYNNTSSGKHISEFTPEILQPIARCLKARDLFNFERVCKSWAYAIDGSFTQFWRQVTILHGFPFFEVEEGKERDTKTDFQMLYRTAGICTKEMINKHLGEIMGNVPPIAKERFEWLCDLDPWKTQEMFRYQTHEWNIVPSHVRRTPDQYIPRAMKGELEIPLPLYNLVTLCNCPISGKGPVRVFQKDLPLNYFNCEELPPIGVNIYFTRKDGVPPQRCLDSEERIASTKEVAPMYLEALKNGLHVLEFGTCPLSGDVFRMTRVPGSIPDCDRMMIIGGFVPGKGIGIGRYDEKVSVTLCVSAAAEPAPVINKGL